MAWKVFPIFSLLLFSTLNLKPSTSQETWIRGGHWESSSELTVSGIDSSLFSHLSCAFASINSSSYQLQFNSSKKGDFASFSSTVKRKNPSVPSILAIWAGRGALPLFSSMINESSTRKSFIDSSISTARLYGFGGLELNGVLPNKTYMQNLGTLLENGELQSLLSSKTSNKQELLLVLAGFYVSDTDFAAYPIDSMKRNLDWLHVVAYDYYVPTRDSLTLSLSALHGKGMVTTDHVIKQWLSQGVPSNKLVLGLPYHGYAWTVVNPDENSVGVPASGPDTADGSMGYKFIKSIIQNYGYGVAAVYNATLVVNLFSLLAPTGSILMMWMPSRPRLLMLKRMNFWDTICFSLAMTITGFFLEQVRIYSDLIPP